MLRWSKYGIPWRATLQRCGRVQAETRASLDELRPFACDAVFRERLWLQAQQFGQIGWSHERWKAAGRCEIWTGAVCDTQKAPPLLGAHRLAGDGLRRQQNDFGARQTIESWYVSGVKRTS